MHTAASTYYMDIGDTVKVSSKRRSVSLIIFYLFFSVVLFNILTEGFVAFVQSQLWAMLIPGPWEDNRLVVSFNSINCIIFIVLLVTYRNAMDVVH